MPKVFISYARSDGPAVQRLTQALTADGVTVWRDLDSLHGGQQWPKVALHHKASVRYSILLPRLVRFFGKAVPTSSCSTAIIMMGNVIASLNSCSIYRIASRKLGVRSGRNV
jgi:hypothetical protein